MGDLRNHFLKLLLFSFVFRKPVPDNIFHFLKFCDHLGGQCFSIKLLLYRLSMQNMLHALTYGV